MKKVLNLLVVLMLFISSCSEQKDKIKEVVKSYSELYQITDGFVESLGTTYQSYGLNGIEYEKYTKDGTYKIMPIGRLVNVRIEKSVTHDEYETLMNDLKEHYKNNFQVNDVYISNGGTIMIDCRR
jgi:PBP1b-binding outer membrane lipoprotein LpoB